MFLAMFGAAIFAVWIYVMFIRTWALTKFPWLEKIDKIWLGSRQVLVGVATSAGGLVVAVHDLVLSSGADGTTLLHELANFVPEKYRPLALAGAMFGGGVFLTWMRVVQTGPVGSSLPSVVEQKAVQEEINKQDLP